MCAKSTRRCSSWQRRLELLRAGEALRRGAWRAAAGPARAARGSSSSWLWTLVQAASCVMRRTAASQRACCCLSVCRCGSCSRARGQPQRCPSLPGALSSHSTHSCTRPCFAAGPGSTCSGHTAQAGDGQHRRWRRAGRRSCARDGAQAKRLPATERWAGAQGDKHHRGNTAGSQTGSARVGGAPPAGGRRARGARAPQQRSAEFFGGVGTPTSNDGRVGGFQASHISSQALSGVAAERRLELRLGRGGRHGRAALRPQPALHLLG